MRILITAGPTREPIDDVRFISNRSSGQMGFALADAAASAGHDVTLLLGPVLLPPGVAERVTIHRFQTTADLESLLAEHFPQCDLLIKAAAVADYRPAERTRGKTPRGHGLKIELEPTPDLVAACAKTKRDDQRIVAFALEDPLVLETRAVEKMKRKRVDAILANPLQTMDAGDIEPVLFYADGRRDAPGRMTKPALAQWLIGTPHQSQASIRQRAGDDIALAVGDFDLEGNGVAFFRSWIAT
ncbi:MAG: phosphopantothenoylcysteine decarboxylase [Phycisphaeraceae bacterium]